jgi:hypothetical protein
MTRQYQLTPAGFLFGRVGAMSPPPWLVIALLAGSTLSCSRSEAPVPKVHAQSATTVVAVSRKDELILEGAINDYCYRQMVKGDVKYVRCYANVSLKAIIVYVYPSESWSTSPVAQVDRDRLKANLNRDIPGEFMAFPDWAWAKPYTLTVVDRTVSEAR